MYAGKIKYLLVGAIMVVSTECKTIPPIRTKESNDNRVVVRPSNKSNTKYYTIKKGRCTVLKFKLNNMIKSQSGDKNFSDYAKLMRIMESSQVYDTVNTLGYLGYYQFGGAALKDLGYKGSKSSFLKDTIVQHAAFVSYCIRNKFLLRKEIKNYCGKVVNKIKITESGMLAAAHLKGANFVKVWLKNNGKMKEKLKCDLYGTNMESYLNKFKGYDTSMIVSQRKVVFK